MDSISKPISVIAIFLPGENPRPYKFKYQEGDELITVKVDHVMHSYKGAEYGTKMISYTCQSFINGVEKHYELRYLIKTCQWQLYKVL